MALMLATMTTPQKVNAVRAVLSEDLRRKPYKDHPNLMVGHCYHASEALYHLLGGAEAGWAAVRGAHSGIVHWWIQNTKTAERLDPTADQFDFTWPYECGQLRRGFLTQRPSQRAREVLQRLVTLNKV